MVQQRHDGQLFTLHHRDADEIYLACDCLGWFPMHKVDEAHWQTSLTLPCGWYHLRYYVRKGKTIYWYGHEDLKVDSATQSLPSGSKERVADAQSIPLAIRCTARDRVSSKLNAADLKTLRPGQ